MALQTALPVISGSIFGSDFAVRIVTTGAGHPAPADLKTSRRFHQLTVLNNLNLLRV